MEPMVGSSKPAEPKFEQNGDIKSGIMDLWQGILTLAQIGNPRA
jgi:hypothetical protein